MKMSLCALVLIFMVSGVHGQSFPADNDHSFDRGSNISLPSLSKQKIKHLTSVGLIWGFLKYHHPAIAEGKYHWDYELFRILPAVSLVSTDQEFDSLMIQWIHSLGPIGAPAKKDSVVSEIKLAPDHSWMTRSSISPDLEALLYQIRDVKKSSDHYYVWIHPFVGYPDFKHENKYDESPYPDTGFRLLALYRYWNIIHYFFPYRYLMDENWNDVLPAFIPKVVAAKNETEYTLAILELIGKIQDTHASVWGNNPALRKFFGINKAPIKLVFVNDQPVVTRHIIEESAEKPTLKIGDIITHVNGRSVAKIKEARLRYTPASNYPTQLRELANSLLRTNDSLIQVKIIREGKRVRQTIKTYALDTLKKLEAQSNDSSFRLVSPDIAYINNELLKATHLSKIWPVIKDTKGLVIDIRNYPYNFPIYDLCNYLMAEGYPFVKFSSGSVTTPGQFTIKQMLKAGITNKKPYLGKIIILVNEITQSSGEFHAMAYRTHPNATVIGSTTAGADGNVSIFYLPGGIRTMISGCGIYYPDGKEIQRVGIIPDRVVNPTLQGIQQGKDELLEAAIQLIRQ
jgi:C-terminal processing protease CtpA/Prc